MNHLIQIESFRINTALADKLLAKFLPQFKIDRDPWVNDPRFDDEYGWYTTDANGVQTYTQQHFELTDAILGYLGDLELNTTETYVFITYYL